MQPTALNTGFSAARLCWPSSWWSSVRAAVWKLIGCSLALAASVYIEYVQQALSEEQCGARPHAPPIRERGSTVTDVILLCNQTLPPIDLFLVTPSAGVDAQQEGKEKTSLIYGILQSHCNRHP